jgi:hypothetical protein
MGGGIKATGDGDVEEGETGHCVHDVSAPTAVPATMGTLFNCQVGAFSIVKVQTKLLKWVRFFDDRVHLYSVDKDTRVPVFFFLRFNIGIGRVAERGLSALLADSTTTRILSSRFRLTARGYPSFACRSHDVSPSIAQMFGSCKQKKQGRLPKGKSHGLRESHG